MASAPTTPPPVAAASGGAQQPRQCLSWTVDETVLFFIGLVGAVAVLVLWLAPVRDIWTGRESVWATKSTARVATGFPYVAALYNCILWNLYATSRPSEFLVPIFVNTAGFLLNASFTWCYWRFSDEKNKWWIQLHLGLFFAYTCVTIALWNALDVEVVGYMAAVVNTLMLFGPLAAAKQVIATRSTQGMPFLPLLFTLVASVIWFLYGLYLCNVQIMIPNGLGIVFGTVQLLLYRWAKKQEELASLEGFDALHEPRLGREPSGLDDEAVSVGSVVVGGAPSVSNGSNGDADVVAIR